jgi:hypothetical protein
MAASVTVKGVVRGKIIELERAPGIPDGQQVTVTVEPAGESAQAPSGRSAGTWFDDPKGLDEYLEWNRQQRKLARRELEP